MSKSSDNDTTSVIITPPSFVNTSISAGSSSAKTVKQANGSTKTTVNSPLITAGDNASKNITSALANLNTFSSDYYTSKQKILDAYKTQQAEDIYETYAPQITSLENDIAKRFGSFTNSSFLDELDSVTDKIADAVADAEVQLTSKSSELDQAQQQNNLDYLTSLLSVASAGQSAYSSLFSDALNLSNNVNSYYNNQYSLLTKNTGTSSSSSSSSGMSAAQLAALIKAGMSIAAL